MRIRLLSLRDPYLSGFAPLHACFEQIGLVNSYTATVESILKNGARPSAQFVPSKPELAPGEPERKRFEHDVNNKFAGGRQGYIMVTNGAYTWQPFSYPPADLAGLEITRNQRLTVANCFDVPISLLQTEDSNRAVAEAGNYQHRATPSSPRCVAIASGLSHMARQVDPRLFFCFDNPVEADLERTTKVVDMRLRNGTLTVNEARARTAGSRSRAATSRSSARAWSGSATPPRARPSRRSRRRCPRRRRPARPTPRKRPTATSPPGSRRRPRKRPRPRPRRKPTERSWRAYSGSWSVWRGPSMKRRTVLTLATATAAIAEVVLLRATKTTTAQNTYGLPIGTPITKELRKWFAEQRAMVLGTLAKLGVELPAKFPPLTDYNDPMASAMTPMIGAYWDEAGKKTRQRLGLDPDAWKVTSPHLKDRIHGAAMAFCQSTNQTTSLQLDQALKKLRTELEKGLLEEGESLDELTKRVESVFDQAQTWRARRIAATEAARAVHAAQEQAAIESGVVAGFEWLISGDACSLCQKIAAEAKMVKAGDAFAKIGHNPHYSEVRHPPAHPSCQCSLVEVLTPEYGGPDNPQWAKTLDQPKADDSDKPPGPAPKPEPAKLKTKAKPKPKPKPKPQPTPAPAPPRLRHRRHRHRRHRHRRHRSRPPNPSLSPAASRPTRRRSRWSGRWAARRGPSWSRTRRPAPCTSARPGPTPTTSGRRPSPTRSTGRSRSRCPSRGSTS